MGFKKRSFDQPTYQEKDEEPTRVIIISCEGTNTEPEYFKAIREKLKDNISSLIQIELVPKPDNASEPINVLNNLDSFVEKYDFKKGNDSLWLVCDREKVEARKNGLLKIIPLCKNKGYSIALLNPLFEFWLLLHLVDISTYDHEKIFNNDRVNSKKRYLDHELSLILGKYNKKKDQFNREIVSFENLQRAVMQEALFENDLNNVIDKLGGNMSSLIKEIVNF
ncbi:MAG: RloB family protein [Gammaproteobacteria bacterium]|uniref:Putative RloB domain-containing protein n=2 Tax=viral metagenome TaxID=1070528 RepID=A0A6M3JAE3_9ZZZZ|nr:RloB family protein [Gammaproteobacteria bacterium]MBU1479299.1 RloB family protein [Gammaproteobacteria bacterium]MBU2002300.1 RloB family protein [Gammaproteobacteria bacterium]MBU2132173.1 RloB family protein [Gammaproteobacteria bacterium]MBU2189554.1 RloB family protein [Gammaproteobacteria bacterium]